MCLCTGVLAIKINVELGFFFFFFIVSVKKGEGDRQMLHSSGASADTGGKKSINCIFFSDVFLEQHLFFNLIFLIPYIEFVCHLFSLVC